MPTAQLPGNLHLYYEDDDFTDPWAASETVILHHGNAKNSQLWYAWVPLLGASAAAPPHISKEQSPSPRFLLSSRAHRGSS